MHCASCASIVQRQLRKAPGIERCDVSLTWEQASISGRESSLRPQVLNPFLAKFGYAIEELGATEKTSLDWKTIWLSASAVLTFLFMMTNVISMQFFDRSILSPYVGNMLFFIFALCSWVLTSTRFVRAIWTFAQTGVANMDTLIGIGTTVAMFSALLALFSPSAGEWMGVSDHGYADVVVVVIGFVYLGQAIEKRLRTKTSASLQALQERLAKTVLVERDDQIEEKQIADITIGDVLRIGAGVIVPTDGVIIEGSSAINESALTGESMPVEKKVGQHVLAGTLNTSGTLRVRVTAIGKETLYGKATEAVLSASREKASIERLTDRIASVFVPIILVFAVLTGMSWFFFGHIVVPADDTLRLAISSVLAVLIVACPCALGLATPTAVSATLGRLTKLGVFVRNTQVLETIGKIDTIIFDKTGTVTIGRPLVERIIPSSAITQEELIELIAGLETDSQHPLATAIQLYAEEQKIKPKKFTDVQTTAGKGIEGTWNGQKYCAGSSVWLQELGIKLPPNTPTTELGQIVIAKDSTMLGTILFHDEVRPGMQQTIEQLDTLGISLVLLSGDTEQHTADIAKKIGISTWKSACRPEEKVAFIDRLQTQKHHVLMIGDGINDTAALAKANISIAVSSGSDTALSVADMTVFSSALEKLPTVLQVGRFGMRVIYENLAWAFGYNLVCIPLAAGILYPSLQLQLSPMIAGTLMSISSISVVANALRITRKKS